MISENSSAALAASGLKDIYSAFTESVKALGSKHGGKLKNSVVNWLAGSRIKTERDIICEKFANDVKAQLELFDAAIEGASKDEKSQAVSLVCKILSEPVNSDSNSTTDLMKRAMVGYMKPFLKDLTDDQLVLIKERMEKAYKKSQRLPVEKDVLKEIDRLLVG